jgi:hypothetical protein
MTKRHRREAERRFRHAPFPLFGLPVSWQGERWLGGGSWGTQGRTETIHALSLGHGGRWEPDTPRLFVQTETPDAAPGGNELQLVAEALWRGRAETLDDAIESRHTDWGVPRGDPFERPVESSVEIPIDGVPTQFAVLSQQESWIAFSRLRTLWLTLNAELLDIADVELVTITELAPYVAGNRQQRPAH